jgi:integrase
VGRRRRDPVRVSVIRLTVRGRKVWAVRTWRRDDQARLWRVERTETCASRELAVDRAREWRAALERTFSRALDREIESMGELIEWFRQEVAVPPSWHDGKRVRGLRSWRRVRSMLKPLAYFFRAMPLRAVTPEAVRRYASWRLETPKADGSRRSIVGVNRELAVLRRMLRLAAQRGWIACDPFAIEPGLVSVAEETRRDRVLSFDEERRLLEACARSRSRSLLARVLLALDAGLRRGEIEKLAWADLDGARVRVRAENSKTARERYVGLTARTREALAALPRTSHSIFPEREFKRAWTVAVRRAGIPDLRFHDLRHTYATRLLQAGVPIAEIARALGHADISTTYRYLNPDRLPGAQAATAARLEAFLASREQPAEPEDVVH